MPQEIGYRQQVQGAAPARLPDASPAAFGAGVGAGVAQLGGSLQNAELRSRQIERKISADQAWSDFATRFADTRSQIDRARIDARTNAAAGGAGHTQAMEETFDAATQGLADGLVESEQRNRAREMIASYRGQIVDDAYGWETGKRVEKMVTDNRSAIDKATARIFTSGDPKSYAQETQALVDSVSGLTGVPADVREKLLKEGNEKLAIAYGNHLIDSNPALAKAAIDAGVFNDVLDGQQLDRLSNGAHAQIRANEAQARAQAAAEAAAAKEDLAAQEVSLRAGAGTYQDRMAIADRFEALGDKSKAAEWRGQAQQFGTVQATADWYPPSLNARVAALRAKQGEKGLMPAEAHELGGLETQSRITDEMLAKPGGALLKLEYGTRRAVPPLNPADPASMRARAQVARVAAQQAGRATIEPFKPDEMPALKDLMEKGAGGRVQVLQALAGFGDAAVIDGAAHQIAGRGDGAFRIASRMLSYPAGMAVAQAIVRGDEVRDKQPWTEPMMKKAKADFFKYYGPALKGIMPPGYVNDLFDGAVGYFASRTNGGAYDAGRFAEAVETVLGRNGGHGGKAVVPGLGIVIAPPTMAPDAMMARFQKATGPDYNAAAGGRHPVFGDGTPMTRPQILRMLPTLLPDQRYGFRAPNGALVHDDKGQVYAVDLMKLPAR